MARTTAGAVELIAEVEEGVDLTPFIEAANALVTEVCAPVVTYDNARLELIERWLSAHFYHIEFPQVHWDTIKFISSRTDSKVDLGLNQTRYGQMAMILDTAGGLSALNKANSQKGGPRKVGVWYLGQEPEVVEDA